MAKISTREGLAEYALRKLGKPVIRINVALEQIEDRIEEAIETFQEKHYDATEYTWVSYMITQEDIDQGFITIPEDVLSVAEIKSTGLYSGGDAMFNPQYQIALNDYVRWGSFDSISYVMRMQGFNSVLDLTGGGENYEFVRHMNKLRLYNNMNNMTVGSVLAAKVFKGIDPETHGSVYNNKWLKSYVTALIKRQWGENLKKYSDIQMLGGVTINGKDIYDEAVEEIEALETELDETYSEPTGFFVG